jgi:hypothetical protein
VDLLTFRETYGRKLILEKGHVRMDWLLLIFFVYSLLPVVRQKLITSARFKAIRRLEMIRRSRVITLIHRQESLNFLGIHFRNYINVEDSEQILRAIRFPRMTLYRYYGSSLLAAYFPYISCMRYETFFTGAGDSEICHKQISSSPKCGIDRPFKSSDS